MPEAERFGVCFCRVCGSILPRVGADPIVGIPAGALDDDPGGRPRLHFFVGSKAPWYEIRDDLPQFESYPPGDH